MSLSAREFVKGQAYEAYQQGRFVYVTNGDFLEAWDTSEFMETFLRSDRQITNIKYSDEQISLDL